MDKFIIRLIVIILMLSSCSSGQKSRLNINVDHINISDIKINRYGKELFEIDTNHFVKGLKDIHSKYKVFLGETLPDPSGLKPLYNFITDTSLIRINKEVQNQYSNLEFLEEELKSAFQHLKFYFPDIKLPKVYTYMSGLNFESPIQISDDAMIIALDLFLGPQFKTYHKYGLPVYITERMTANHIIVNCMKEFYFQYFRQYHQPKNFLEEIIHHAKALYFIDAMLPNTADHLKIAYSEKQFEWCKQNEHNIWALFIDKQILYSANYEVNRKFTQDGPFTLAISKEAPARIGYWIGWQILKAYMENNRSLGLYELIKEKDMQKILKLSSYKPKKQ